MFANSTLRRGLASGLFASCCGALFFNSMISSVTAQVVQLPSTRNFSYSGSAWVPDAGTASLGGTGYTSSSAVQRGWGPYAGRAAGGGMGANSLTASVQIIDLKALDDAILGANVSRDPNSPAIVSANSPAADGTRNFLSTSALGASMPGPGTTPSSVPDANRWQRALTGDGIGRTVNPSQTESDIRFYLLKGKQAELANRVLASRVYYRMAIEAMTPEMIQRYEAILVEREAAEEELRKRNRTDRIKF